MQEKWITSVGIDVGTSTTKWIVSKLKLLKTSGGFSLPHYEITERRLDYASPIYTTPLMNREQQVRLFEKLAQLTPARIGVGRSGTRPLTDEILKLRLAHAQAVDSVYGEVFAATLDAFGLFTVHTMFGDKETYLKRPEKGRVLTMEAGEAITERCIHKPQVQIVISDGLSAKAVDDNCLTSCQP